MEKLLLRPSEVQQLLGFGRSKTYALLASGELPKVRIGKSMRVPAEALRQWVQDQTIPAIREEHKDDPATR